MKLTASLSLAIIAAVQVMAMASPEPEPLNIVISVTVGLSTLLPHIHNPLPTTSEFRSSRGRTLTYRKDQTPSGNDVYTDLAEDQCKFFAHPPA
jgi:hypothetical protein